MTTPVQKQYTEKAIGELKEKLDLSNALAAPRIEKTIINVGLGRALKDASNAQKLLEDIQEEVALLAGQHPVVTKARKSIASFNIREGDPLGLKVTLRGKRMYDFLDRLVAIALPRSRDFKGIPLSDIDEAGNLNIGIREHTVFPEVSESNHSVGLQINMVTTASSRAQGIELFRSLNFPLQKEE